jgi:hypothetical protein
MEMNFALVLIIAIVLTLTYEFFQILVSQVTTGVWDYGYLIATFVYSVVVGFIAAFSGVLNLNMPLEQMIPVLIAVWGQYFLYLTALHAVMDYMISKLFPTQPQGLATKFLKTDTRMQLSRK